MTPIEVLLERSDYFMEHTNLSKLNELIYKHESLSPAQVMAATGCRYKDAFYVLVRLYGLHLAEGFLEIYNREHKNVRLEVRPFSQGLPRLPVQYDYNDRTYTIRSESQLLLSPIFKLNTSEIKFVSLLDRGNEPKRFESS